MEELEGLKKLHLPLLTVLTGTQRAEFCHHPVVSIDLCTWKPHSRIGNISGVVRSEKVVHVIVSFVISHGAGEHV